MAEKDRWWRVTILQSSLERARFIEYELNHAMVGHGLDDRGAPPKQLQLIDDLMTELLQGWKEALAELSDPAHARTDRRT